ncbi:histidinol-phosphate transaminase [candidate division FCPU426 bacterium]|nr:histidinol-phosphate transaminase [candidate division FCPU426 bacterium]
MKKNPLLPRECVLGIEPYQPGKPVEEVKRELGVARAIKLASNENPYGPSPRVRAALRREIGRVHIYPDSACFTLTRDLARYLQCREEEIIIGNGSNELLVLLGMAYLGPEDEVLTSQMTFVVYETVARLMNAKLVATPPRDYSYDLEAMARKISPRTRLVFISNPNNPTGTVVDPHALKRFLDRIPPACLAVLDEAYYEYADDSRMGPTVQWVRERQNLVVLRTFSKAYALAGLRVGYGIMPPEVKSILDRIRPPFNVNSLAQVAAIAALADQPYMRQCVEKTRTERKRVGDALTAMGFKAVPSQANFLFLQGRRAESRACAQALMKAGVIVRPFPGPYLRMTLGLEAENNKCLRAMRAFA